MNLQLISSLCLPLELEQSYEIKRTERKNRKSRGRPPKRARRDKEVSRGKTYRLHSSKKISALPINVQKLHLFHRL